MADISHDEMKKKLRMASNAGGYKDILDEQNVLQQENILTQENFQRFEQGGWNMDNKEEKKRAALFRSQLKEAMMWDKESARAFKDEEGYKDIFEEAKKEKKQLKIDANRTGASKVFHDITGSKKKMAQDKLERMAKLKERLPEKNTINDLFDEKKAKMDELIRDTEAEMAQAIQDAKDFIRANEPNVDPESFQALDVKNICIKYNSVQITDEMSEEEKKAVYDYNEKVYEKYDDIYTKHNAITQTYINHGRGAFTQREVLYHCSRKRLKSNAVARLFKEKYEEADKKGLGGAPTSDIVRDLGRWVKDIDDDREVDFTEMKQAFDHTVNINTVTILGGRKKVEVQKTDKNEVKKDEESEKKDTKFVDTVDQDTYKASVEFCKDKLKLYQKKALDFLKDHPELDVPYPKYEDLVKNCERLQDLYKTGQSLNNLGKNLCYSLYRYIKTTREKPLDAEKQPDMENIAAEAGVKEIPWDVKELAEITDIAAEVGAANIKIFELVKKGKSWDLASTDVGHVPTLEDLIKNDKTGDWVPISSFAALKDAAIEVIANKEVETHLYNEHKLQSQQDKSKGNAANQANGGNNTNAPAAPAQ